MTAPDGMPINGVRGAVDTLARLIESRRPLRVLVATDEDWRPLFRVELIPSYKTHRTAEPVPPLLEPQMPIAWDILAAAGIQIVRGAYEAEDVIATICARVEGRIEILSGDRDLFALVRDPTIKVLYPEGKGRLGEVDEAEITRRYSIPGRAYLDFAVLRGDPSDGLPGLPGVGDRKAAALVSQHGSVERMIERGLFGPVQQDYLRRALAVVSPSLDPQVEFSSDLLPASPPDPAALARLGKKYGVDGPIGRLTTVLASVGADASPAF